MLKYLNMKYYYVYNFQIFQQRSICKNEKNEQMWGKKELAYVGRGLFGCLLNYFFNTTEIRCRNSYSRCRGSKQFPGCPSRPPRRWGEILGSYSWVWGDPGKLQ